MKKMKQLIIKSPEYYLFVFVILAGYTPPFYFNSLFVLIAAILALQIVFENKVFGLLLASILLIANLLMLGALISEFNEFPEFSLSAMQLLLGGLSIWCLNSFFLGIMIYKYSKIDKVSNATSGHELWDV